MIADIARKQTNTGTSVALFADTLIYEHTISRTLPTCANSLGSLTLLAPEAGDVVELIPLCYLGVCIATMLRDGQYGFRISKGTRNIYLLEIV
jgi:hypothetical protein